MTAPVVECVDASKSFGGVTAVDRVSFALEPGEILSILGTSGCGKTSVLRLIAGFEAPDEGEIWIEGRVVSADHTLVPPEKRGVGMVFQEYALFPHMTVTRVGSADRTRTTLPPRALRRTAAARRPGPYPGAEACNPPTG